MMKSRKQLAEEVGRMISDDRQGTHGNPHLQFVTAQQIKGALTHASKGTLAPTHLESMQMIATKLSRIAHGDPRILDHWLDIAGYALIAAEACQMEQAGQPGGITRDENI